MQIKQTQILVDGPQGSGKTTISGVLASTLKIPLVRGIPDGNDLKSLSRFQIWMRSKRLPNYDAFVSDRSIISIWAYESGKFPVEAERIGLVSLQILKRMCAVKDTVLIVLDSDADKCLKSQRDGICKIEKPEDMEREVNKYSEIYDTLIAANINCFRHRLEGSLEYEISQIINKIISA